MIRFRLIKKFTVYFRYAKMQEEQIKRLYMTDRTEMIVYVTMIKGAKLWVVRREKMQSTD